MVVMNTEDRSVEPAAPPADAAPVGPAAQAAPGGEERAYAAPPPPSATPPLRYPEQMTGSVVDALV
jgi:hypothetical protein